MISRLTISNYQSIAEADLQLGQLTVLVGDNRAGKSATLRALRALLFNETGTDQIRRDQKTAVVSIKLEETTVTWEKKRAGGATYVLTNNSDSAAVRSFTKLGSTVPSEVEDVLGIRAIKVSDTVSLTPQVHAQEDYAFLLDLPAGQAAKALAKFTRLDVVVEAQGAIRADIRRSKQDVISETRHIEDAELRLSSYQGLDMEEVRLKALEELVDEAVTLKEDLHAAHSAWEAYRAAKALASRKVLPEEALLTQATGEWQELTRREAVWQEYLRALGVRDVAETKLALHDASTWDDQKAWGALKVCPECGQPVNA